MINGQIRDKEVRLIGADGEQLGIVPIAEAQQKADSANLDLVLIAPQAKPPVCKIIDYGKYRFETVKKEREHRKNQKIMVIKEIRLSSNIDEHDFMVKVNHAIKFLKEGDKVKTSIRFRGREITHAQLGQQCLERFGEKVSEFGVVEKRPKLEGRSMTMFIAPITKEGSR
jgi:translation initiation factor IF-3